MFGLNRIVLSATVGFLLIKLFALAAPSIEDDQTIQNDEIISKVVDINSSSLETTAILNHYNLSREDVERKISRINDSNVDDTVSRR